MKYLIFKKANTPTQVKDEFDAGYGHITTVKFWATEFKQGRTSLRNDARSGCPKNANTYFFVLEGTYKRPQQLANT